jgi:hypothetical protein
MFTVLDFVNDVYLFFEPFNVGKPYMGIKLKLILKNQWMKRWTGFLWLGIESSGRDL